MGSWIYIKRYDTKTRQLKRESNAVMQVSAHRRASYQAHWYTSWFRNTECLIMQQWRHRYIIYILPLCYTMCRVLAFDYQRFILLNFFAFLINGNTCLFVTLLMIQVYISFNLQTSHTFLITWWHRRVLLAAQNLCFLWLF